VNRRNAFLCERGDDQNGPDSKAGGTLRECSQEETPEKKLALAYGRSRRIVAGLKQRVVGYGLVKD
jgi:hypothetical protein